MKKLTKLISSKSFKNVSISNLINSWANVKNILIRYGDIQTINFYYRIYNFRNNITFYLHSGVLVPGTSLINNGLMGAVYICWLIYLFIGINTISDIFME